MDQRKIATKKSYDEVANLYANDLSRDFTHFEFIDELLKYLGTERLSDFGITDLGSAHGLVPEYILEKKKIAIKAVDISRFFCSMLESKFKDFPVEVICSDMTEYLKNRPDGSIGAITANFSIIHIPDEEIDMLFGLIASKLVAGGLFFASVHEGTFKGLMREPYQKQNDPRLTPCEKLEVYMNFFTVAELEKRLSRSGFEIIRIESFKPEKNSPLPENDKIFLLVRKKFSEK